MKTRERSGCGMPTTHEWQGFRHDARMPSDIESLTQALREFAQAREWEPFHSPKNLASALAVEAAELLEHFQWMTEEQSRQADARKKEEIAAEAADVFLYLLQLCDKLGIDLAAAARLKMAANATRYPVERSRGTSKRPSGQDQ
jgi:NTP pyrophosphatase (non-canonical NTP hydrolase)